MNDYALAKSSLETWLTEYKDELDQWDVAAIEDILSNLEYRYQCDLEDMDVPVFDPQAEWGTWNKVQTGVKDVTR